MHSSLPTGHEVTTASHYENIAQDFDHNYACNNYIPLPQQILHKCTRPFCGGGAGQRDYTMLLCGHQPKDRKHVVVT